MIWLLTKYHLTAAIKDKLLIGLLSLVAVGISLSIFLGSASITEKDQFSLVFAASGLRIGGLFTLVLFTVFYIRRSFETHGVDYLLSKPLSRLEFLMSYTLALSLLALSVTLFIVLALAAMPGKIELNSLMLWGGSISVELIIMVNVALFFSLMLPSAVTASLMSVAFYVLARLIGGILAIIETGSSGAHVFLEKLMLLVSVFIPRLDLMGQTSWLIYEVDEAFSWSFILLQGVIFCGLIFAASLWDLHRKQF